MVIGSVLIYAFFPILINHSGKLMPPLLLAGVSNLIAALGIFFFWFMKKREKINLKMLLYLSGISLLIIILPSILIYTGSRMTSGINTAILLQTELLFTFLTVGRFTEERLNVKKIIGAILIGIGTVIVLYQGTFMVNWGDLFIIAGTFFYPMGNILGKNALKMMDSISIIFFRSLFGGSILLMLSLVFENYTETPMNYLKENLFFVMINGLLMYGFSRIFWYEGLKRIDVSKAVSLAMTGPAFSLIYAYLFLKEVPGLYQILGTVIIFGGIFYTTKKGGDPTVSIPG